MIHETNPIIQIVHNLRVKKRLPVDKPASFPECPVDKEPCAHYDGPFCNNFSCGLVNKTRKYNDKSY